MAFPQRFGVESLSDEYLDLESPYCIHGPTLLFERYYQDKEPRKFFACAVHRDRKGCPFFQWADEKITEEKRERWKAAFVENQSLIDGKRLRSNFLSIKALPPQSRYYCPRCGVLILESQLDEHQGHDVRSGVSDSELLKPSRLVTPADDKKSNAQFYFSDSCVMFMCSELKRLKFTRVLCVGTPRLHESLQGVARSLLLDIDHRYAQFYSPDQYQRYNMFNNYFYDSQGQKVCHDFLSVGGDSIAIVIDPPFGGLANILAQTIRKLWSVAGKELSTFLIFPYYCESHVLSALPSLWMMDYQVTYENHKHFSEREKSKPSPVRIFTNLPKPGLCLPASERYRLCVPCNRFVAKNNVHCEICEDCTSKDGRSYVHCYQCGICVKSGRNHCNTCNTCQLPTHTCGTKSASAAVGCHICGSFEHKRRDCPDRKPLGKGHSRKRRSLSKKTKDVKRKKQKTS